MSTTSQRGNEKCKCLRKSLSDTIGLIVILYCVYFLANMVFSGYITDHTLTKVFLDLWSK